MHLIWGFLDPLYLGWFLYISAAPKHKEYPWPTGRRGNRKKVKIVIILILDVEKDAVETKLIPCT